MVLIVGSDIVSTNDITSLDTLFAKYPHLLTDAQTLAAKKPRVVRPQGVYYVRQKVGM